MRRQHTMNGVGDRVRRGTGALLVVTTVALLPAAVAPAAEAGSALDPGFGGDGLVLTDFSGGEDGAEAVAAGPGDTVVAAGFGDLGDPGRPFVAGFAVARYLGDGTPDPGFSGDGRTLVDFGFVNQSAAALAIDSAARIVTTGTITTFDGSTSSIGVARLLADGTPDPGFGGDGRVVVQPGLLSAAYDVAVDAEDRVVVLGAATGSRGFRPLVMRFTGDGELDSAFGRDGIAAFGRAGDDLYGAIAVDGRDRLLLAGSSALRPGGDGFPAVRRLTAGGSPDPSFGADGIALPFPGAEGDAADLARDASGRIVVTATCECGRSGDDFAAARLAASGRRDRSFGDDGRAYVRFGRRDARPAAIAIDGAGRIVLGGAVRVNGDNVWALARLRPGGGADPGFGHNGTVTERLGPGVAGAMGVAVDSAARVYAAGLGLGPLGSDFGVARLR